jgi:hypothetical protein
MPSVCTTRAVFHFYGNEDPSLSGPLTINPGAPPIQISNPMSVFLSSIPGLVVVPDAPPAKKE